MIKPFIREITETKVALCRAGSCCCELEKQGEDLFILTDDFGGSVKLDKNDLKLLPEAVKRFV
jgi:hypothetical protein